MDVLTIPLDPSGPTPLYLQLYAAIKGEIRSGRIPYGERLPSKRRLSAHLHISQNTVQSAYDQLIAEGYVQPIAKRGFFVCRVDEIMALRPSAGKPLRTAGRPSAYRYDFSHSGVDGKNFPFPLWRKLTREVLSEYDPDLLRLGPPQGEPGLRNSIADYLHQSRGVNCSPHQIVISAGAELLLQLLIQLLGQDSIYALENPGYEKMAQIFGSGRAAYRSIPLDEEGMDLAALARSDANIACITPSHQFPTGVIMPIGRRVRLLNWALARGERYIIEDDYDSEFKYSGRSIPSLQSLDVGQKVVYIGAFSKSLSPALRVSYMVLPQPLLERYHERLHFYLCPVPTSIQKVLQRFMDEGHFARHLSRMRNVYRKKREILVESLHKALPNACIRGQNVGLHLLVQPNNGLSERELVQRAQRRGIRVYGLSNYYNAAPGAPEHPTVLLGYATLEPGQIEDAIQRLGEAWKQARTERFAKNSACHVPSSVL